TDSSPSAVVVADFNHDGHKDIAVANESGDVSVLLNNGDGTFQPAVQYTVGGEPLALAVGDFNGDGNMDLAVATADPGGGAGNVVILVGAGDGTFTTGGSFAVGVQPDAIVAASFGTDHFMDLAVANRNSQVDSSGNDATLGPGSVSVLRGNGDGTFQTAVNYAVGDQPTSLAVGDVNGDGNMDLAVANAATQDVSLLLGQPDGTFLPEPRLDLRHEPAVTLSGNFSSSVLLGDFNGDGHLDLALANSADVGVRVRVALGAGDGTFGPAQAVVVGGAPQALVAADFSGTGRLGFATADGTIGAVTVRLGLGDGTFQAPPRISAVNDPNGLVAADFNDAGINDIAVANDGAPGGASVLLGNGDGTFQSQTQFATGVSTAVAAADLRSDGLMDLVTTNFESDTAQGDLTVLLGRGDGRFRPAVHYTVGGDPVALAIADFNGDGVPDIAVVDYLTNDVSILLGNGDGTFQPAVQKSVGMRPGAIVAGRFGNDRFIDLAVANENVDDNGNPLGPGSVSVLRGNGDGTFQPAVQYTVAGEPLALAAGDFNGDGSMDLAVATADPRGGAGSVVILVGAADGTFTSGASFGVGVRPDAIVAGDFSGDANLDLHNGDNPLDLATANSGSNNITVLMGLGNGDFDAPVSYAVGQFPTALIAADLNGDGRLDLACANGIGHDVSVLLGIGDGTFVAPDKFSSNAIDSTPTLADVTGDGVPDSIVLNGAGQILVRPGRANEPGAFDAARIVNPTQPARAFTIVQSAGRNLIAAVDRDSNSVSLYALDANGISTLVGRLQTDLQPVRIAAADLTGDGRQDLVVANAGSGDVSIFLATATGGFTALAPLSATDHPAEIALVDLNGDGLPEIVLTDDVAGTITVLLNQGGGAFASPVHYRSTTGQAGFDLNGDGAPTLLSLDGAGSFVAGDFTENGTTDMVVVNPGDASLSFLEGDGAGGFLNPQRIVAGLRPKIVRAGHFFSDGHLDLAVLDADNHTITILRGDGHGDFQFVGQYDAGNSPNGLSIGDFDGNGIFDLIVGNDFGDVMALLGNGDGTFSPFSRIGKGIAISVSGVSSTGQQFLVVSDQTRDRVVLEIGSQTSVLPGPFIAPRAVKLADLNGDGIPDLIAVNSGANDILVYQGLGNGHFAAPVAFYSGTDPVDVEVGIVDPNDPHDPHELPDVIVTNQGSNDVSIFQNVVQAKSDPPSGWLELDRRLKVGLSPVSTNLVQTPNHPLPSLLVTNSGSNNVLMVPTINGGSFADPSMWTTFNTGATPQAAIVGSFFGGAGLDLVTLN
ncbi:MAG TPA: VCBS repeat-containing protein, partial [Pirellulales bacterium]|nr:VCBS repeat-containing protein [Pirellulales bacterium]